jgi:RimJ/RimL family protein N-acetyltransferase
MTIREPICGELVCLVPLSTDSVGDWVRWMDDPGTTRYLYAPGEEPKTPHTPSSLLDWGRRILADPDRIVFGLSEQPGGRLVGDARLTPVARNRARFSIMIGVGEYRGRGIGTEATRLVCRYGFTRMALREILLDVDPRNVPAVRAYHRVGFEAEGITTMRLRRSRWLQVEAAQRDLYTGPPDSTRPPT